MDKSAGAFYYVIGKFSEFSYGIITLREDAHAAAASPSGSETPASARCFTGAAGTAAVKSESPGVLPEEDAEQRGVKLCYDRTVSRGSVKGLILI